MEYLLKSTKLIIFCILLLTGSLSAFGQTKFLSVKNPLPNKYIVVLEDNVQGDVTTIAQNLTAQYGGQIGFIYDSALFGFSMESSEKQALSLSEDSVIKYITQDSNLHLSDTQPNAPWNLDRLDQKTYRFPPHSLIMDWLKV